MKFTLSWLKKHLETDASLEQICETLTDIGLEVEDLTDRAAEFAPFKVAYVEAAEKHPDADKLQVCTRAGMKAIFAPDGTYIPGLDVTLKKTKIRGVESNGMLVSEKEMMLSEEHNGIIEVDDAHEIGTPMAEIYGLDDPIIEIALTPNRADCAGIYGIARDLAAAGLGTLKDVDTSAVKGTFSSPIGVSIEDTDGCPQFLGRYIKGIKNGESPEWLKQQLTAIGLRPISALVDITNLMTMDFARPLHVYDADKVSGNITVRVAKAGEEFDALNDKSYKIEADGPVGITDDSGLIGLGGIVGGTSTGCDEGTVNVFVEAAYFTPERIARAGRDLGVSSDARYRFDRGVDPEFTAPSMEIATRLILELCGDDSTQVSEVVEAGGVIDWKRSIDFDPSYTTKLIGTDVPEARQTDILTSLGFEVSGGKVTPPSWRGDVFGKADITEEVIRIVGFDQIEAQSVTADSGHYASAETPTLTRGRLAKSALTARGLHECVTWSFTNAQKATAFANDAIDLAPLTLKNAISSELDVMRPSILPNLIEAAGRNAARGYGDVALCEVGPVFKSAAPEGQDIVAAGVRAGNAGPRHWSGAEAHRGVDLYDAKEDAMKALNACGAPADNAQVSNDTPNYSVVGFEVFLENIPTSKKSGTAKSYLTLEPLQPVSRDFAFLVDADVTAENIIRAAKGGDKKLITDASVFDVYVGKGVPEGQKSVALNITIQPKGDSLTDKDLDALMSNVIASVEKRTGGVLRG